jgi:hypothetical protein
MLADVAKCELALDGPTGLRTKSMPVSTSSQSQPEGGSNYDFEDRVDIRRFIDDSSQRRINNLGTLQFTTLLSNQNHNLGLCLRIV